MQDLLFVVPFVTKVMESCALSKVFRPPSPWTMAILGVLCELHNLQEVKLNLKFAVEVLCKNLSIEMEEIPISDLLKDEHRPIKEQLVTAKEKAAASGGTYAFSFSCIRNSLRLPIPGCVHPLFVVYLC